MKIAINGFGRIGRNFLRALLLDANALKYISIAVINVGSARLDMIAHMFQYDSLMGVFPQTVQLKEASLIVGDTIIPIITESDPASIDWRAYEIDWVIEASGHFTERLQAQKHISAGAKKVLITAPAKNADVTIIMGVNQQIYNDQRDAIVALGSCTTNAFLPMLKVIHEQFGIETGLMTTIHAYTNSQVLLDVEGEDLRRSRAAALNIIPTTTGVSELISELIPELQGCIQAIAIRVPTPKVSLIDFTFCTKKSVSVNAINEVFEEAAYKKPLQGILSVAHVPLVSTDFNGSLYSVIIDALLTHSCGQLAKVCGWYDNEWAFSVRIKDFLLFVNGIC